jgi:hypothetical protein
MRTSDIPEMVFGKYNSEIPAVKNDTSQVMECSGRGSFPWTEYSR